MKVILRAQTTEEEILFEVGAMKITVGRHSSNIVRIKDHHCSHTHCVFWIVGKKLFIEDQKSKNGTFVNGIRIQRNQVFIQDKISIGDCLITVSSSHNTPDIIKSLDFPGTLDDRTTIGLALQTSSRIDLIRLNPRSALSGDSQVFGKRITQKIIRPRGYRETILINKWHQSWRHWLAVGIDVTCLLIAFGTPFIVLLWLDDTLDEYTSMIDLITSPNLSMASLGSLLFGFLFRHINVHFPKGTIGERLTKLSQVPVEDRTKKY